MKKFRVIDTELKVQAGRDKDTFREAVQLRDRCLDLFPDRRYIIKEFTSND